MSWIADNLDNALDTWNSKLGEIWQLITQSLDTFKGGTIWNVIVNIHDGVKGIALGLLVLFFVVGVVKTCGSFAEVKRSYRTQPRKAYLSVIFKRYALQHIMIFR